MLDYKLIFKSIFILMSLVQTSFGQDSSVVLYSYQAKENVNFTELLSEKSTKVLFVSDNCSACEALFETLGPRKLRQTLIGVIKAPSFTWMAKKRRQNFKNVIYNIKNLNLDFNKGTPQLFEFDSKGELIKSTYGRTNIIQKFNK